MADKYSNNGYNSGDFDQGDIKMEQDGEDASGLNEKAGEYVRELLSEKIKLNNQKFPVCCKLIDQEVQHVQSSGRIPRRDNKYVDVLREKPVKVAVKVIVPVKEYPKFNFVGKLLGPKGNTMKQMQEDTMCKMAVLGRGSMRDRQKEEELRNSLDPKYSHLTDELHVEVSALAPPAEAYARIAYGLAEVKKYMVPDNGDMNRPPPMRDLMERGGPPRPRPPPGRAPPRMPQQLARPPPGKAKVMSILDRARSSLETSYGYEDPYQMPEPPTRGPPPRAPETDYFYDRADLYYEEDAYYKEDQPRDFKSVRDVGTRRAAPPSQRHYARQPPYARPPK